MIFLGLDPGLADTGWGVVQSEGSRLLYLAHGCISTPAGTPLELRLRDIYQAISGVLDTYKPGGVAVEALFFSKNVSSAMAVAHARGVAYLAVGQRSLPLREFTPAIIKQAVSGTGRADKSQVQGMVRIILGMKDIPKPDHAADALAAAICLAHMGRIQNV